MIVLSVNFYIIYADGTITANISGEPPARMFPSQVVANSGTLSMMVAQFCYKYLVKMLAKTFDTEVL